MHSIGDVLSWWDGPRRPENASYVYSLIAMTYSIGSTGVAGRSIPLCMPLLVLGV